MTRVRVATAAAVALILLLTGCAVNTSNDVAKPRPGVASGGPLPAQAPANLPGLTGSSGDYVTRSSFAGEVSFEKKQSRGVTDAKVTNKHDDDGPTGFSIEFSGPEAFTDTQSGSRTLGEELHNRTAGSISYQGNGGYTTGTGGQKTQFSPEDLPYITGFVCGTLTITKKVAIDDFCVARYAGQSFWWTYFGASTMHWQSIDRVVNAQADYFGTQALCQISPANVCVGADKIGAAPTYSPNVGDIHVWAMSCTGKTMDTLTPGCLLPQAQVGVQNEIGSPESECGGKLFHSRECALINIVPVVERIKSKADGAYDILGNPQAWSNPKVCGDPTWVRNSTATLVKSWRGYNDRNVVVLLKSDIDSAAEISGDLSVAVAPNGNCGDASSRVTATYNVKWSPKSGPSKPYHAPAQSCRASGGAKPATGDNGCILGSTTTIFRDQTDQSAANYDIANSAIRLVTQTFLHMIEETLTGVSFVSSIDGAFGAAAAFVLAFMKYVESTYAYLFTTVFVGNVA